MPLKNIYEVLINYQITKLPNYQNEVSLMPIIKQFKVLLNYHTSTSSVRQNHCKIVKSSHHQNEVSLMPLKNI